MKLAELFVISGQQQNDATRKEYGVVTGIVVDIVDPQKLGRIRVDFPDLADTETEGVAIEPGQKRAQSNWARVATLMAGAGRGSYFVPEVNDEVIVAFEHGDLSRPIVLGTLWNSKDKPPVEMDGNGENNIRAIHSRSGHKIVLDDSQTEPSIRIGDREDENYIFFDLSDGSMQIRVLRDISISAGGDITIRADGKITIDGGQDISIKTRANLKHDASGNINMDSAGSASYSAKAGLSIETTGKASMKGSIASIEGSGMTEVKGGLVKIN